MITGHVHESRPKDILACSLENERQFGLSMIPISGSTQPRVSVKHMHPFCLKGVKLSEPLIFDKSCLFLTKRLLHKAISILAVGNISMELKGQSEYFLNYHH